MESAAHKPDQELLIFCSLFDEPFAVAAYLSWLACCLLCVLQGVSGMTDGEFEKGRKCVQAGGVIVIKT